MRVRRTNGAVHGTSSPKPPCPPLIRMTRRPHIIVSESRLSASNAVAAVLTTFRVRGRLEPHLHALALRRLLFRYLRSRGQLDVRCLRKPLVHAFRRTLEAEHLLDL